MATQPFSVRVELAGVQAEMRRLGRRAADLSRVLAGPVDVAVTRFFERRFQTSGTFAGTAWPSITLVTSRLRARRGRGRYGPTAVLRDTGRLMASLVKRSAPEGIRVVAASELRRGTSVPYAEHHQRERTQTRVFGRRRRVPLRVPARPIVPEDGLDEGTLLEIEGHILRHLET